MTFRIFLAVTCICSVLAGCGREAQRECAPFWAYRWTGETSNLYGSEQARDASSADSIFAPSVRSWMAKGDRIVAVGTGSSSPVLLLQFSSTAGSPQFAGATQAGTLLAWLLPPTDISPVPLLDRIQNAWPDLQSASDALPVPLRGEAMGYFAGVERLSKLSVDLISVTPMPFCAIRYEGLDSKYVAPLGDTPDWLQRRTRSADHHPASIRGEFTGFWMSGRPGLPVS